MFVDRSAHYSDGHIRISQAGTVRGCHQLLTNHSLEEFFRGFLHERHLAAVDTGDLVLIDIQQNHVQAAVREYDSQRQADMTTSAYDDQFLRFVHEVVLFLISIFFSETLAISWETEHRSISRFPDWNNRGLEPRQSYSGRREAVVVMVSTGHFLGTGTANIRLRDAI